MFLLLLNEILNSYIDKAVTGPGMRMRSAPIKGWLMQSWLLLNCPVWDSKLHFLYVTGWVQTSVLVSAVNCILGFCRSKQTSQNKEHSFQPNKQAAWSSVTKAKWITKILTNVRARKTSCYWLRRTREISSFKQKAIYTVLVVVLQIYRQYNKYILCLIHWSFAMVLIS